VAGRLNRRTMEPPAPLPFLRAVVLDWSGTTVDHGSLAPLLAVLRTFEEVGVALTREEARGPMGRAKRDHVAALLELPRVRRAWHDRYGVEPDEHAVDTTYARLDAHLLASVAERARPITGVLEAISAFRTRGLAVGSCTGFTRSQLAPVAERARVQGFAPDVSVCSDEVAAGRPNPDMLLENARLLGIASLASIVKIGDTVADVLEGRRAGAWSIALTRTGNEIGLDEDEWATLPSGERSARLSEAEGRLREAGAHDVVESLLDAVPLIDAIEARLARGERP
jgi:phosphonoacetaldehyde hydrolase